MKGKGTDMERSFSLGVVRGTRGAREWLEPSKQETKVLYLGDPHPERHTYVLTD